MPNFVANSAFDMNDMVTNGSLSEFFYWGDVQLGTSTELIVDYADETMSERLYLTGDFQNYNSDGFPTTGTVTGASYTLNGVTLFTITGMSISVEDFTNYVLSDNLAGLFQDILSGADLVSGSSGNDVLFGYGGNDTVRGGTGDDQLFGGDGHDLLSEYSGIDGPFGNDLYDGGAGVDRVSYYEEYGYGVTIDLRSTAAQNTGVYGTDTFVSIEHITATYGDDTLTGGDEANWFWTFNGHDVLSGNGGDDLFTVGLGPKVVDGGSGVDTIEILDLAYEPAYTADGITVSLLLQGQAQETGVGTWTLSGIENLGGSYGSDDFTGDGNANVLAGYEGDDTLRGGGGDDILSGDGGYDVGYGSSAWELVENPTWEGWAHGDDYLDGGTGADRMVGGGGNDTYVVDNAGDVVVESAGQGTDLVYSSISYALGEDVEDLRLLGTASINATGNSLNNLLVGTSGNNVLNGGAGADTMWGGAGNDTYHVDDIGDSIAEAAGAGDDLVYSSVSHALGNNVETLRLLGSASVNATGNALSNLLVGNAGHNVLNGGAGADTMWGGGGDDTYWVDNAGDSIAENPGSGSDTVYSSISYVLTDHVETLRLLGSAAINASGNSLNNLLVGNAGNNVLNGGAGADTMWGGGGDDRYYIDNVGDSIAENASAGHDTVYSAISYTLGANMEDLRLLGSASINGFGNNEDNLVVGNSGANSLAGGAGNDTLWGGAGNDRMWGEDGNDTLDGGAGADEMNGGTGNDNYYVDNAGDQVIEYSGAGRDTVYSSISYTLGNNVEDLRLLGSASIDAYGNSGSNLLVGNGGANTLHGGSGNDTLWAGAGNDRLIGGTGRDVMAGGAGADRFAFDDGHFGGTTAATADVIQDFSQAQGDLIELAAVDANTLVAGDQAFAFIGTTAFSGIAGELRYEQVGGNTHVYGDTNGDGIADFMVLLNGNLALNVGDFVI